MVWIAFVGSDPIETEAASVSLVVIGPSIVIGKAVVLGTKALISAKASFDGSYLIWNFTKDIRFVPGLTMISTEKVSPIFFWIGALIVDTGVNERDVEALARLRVSCCLFNINRVRGAPIAKMISKLIIMASCFLRIALIFWINSFN